MQRTHPVRANAVDAIMHNQRPNTDVVYLYNNSADILDIKKGFYDKKSVIVNKLPANHVGTPMCVMVNTERRVNPNDIRHLYTHRVENYTNSSMHYSDYILATFLIDDPSMRNSSNISLDYDAYMFTRLDKINARITEILSNGVVACHSSYVKMMLMHLKSYVMNEGVGCDRHSTSLLMRKVIVRFDGDTPSRMANACFFSGTIDQQCDECTRLKVLYTIYTCSNDYDDMSGDAMDDGFMHYLSDVCLSGIPQRTKLGIIIESILAHLVSLCTYYETTVQRKTTYHVTESLVARKVLNRQNVVCDIPRATKVLSLLFQAENAREISLKHAKYADSNATKLVIVSQRTDRTSDEITDTVLYANKLKYMFVLHKPLFNDLGVVDCSLVRYDRSGKNAISADLNQLKPTVSRTSYATAEALGSKTSDVVRVVRDTQQPVVTLKIDVSHTNGPQQDFDYGRVANIMSHMLITGVGEYRTSNQPSEGDHRYRYVFNDVQDINRERLIRRVKTMGDIMAFKKSVLKADLTNLIQEAGFVKQQKNLIQASVYLEIYLGDRGMYRLTSEVSNLF